MRKTAADVAILGGLCLVLLAPFLISGRTVLPVDWMGITPSGPYKYDQPRQPHHYTLDPTGSIGGDTGWTAFTADSLRHGIIPFWNPFQSLGEPFLSEGGNQILYPPNWLHIIVPIQYWDVLRFLHLFLAAWFVYLFALECGLERWPALLAGSCVYAQGFFQGFLAMNMILAACTWLPLVLLGVERYLNGKRSAASFVAVFAGTFLLATGSHPGLVIVCAVTTLAYLVLRCLSQHDFSPALRLAVPFVAGVLCSAPAWVPFLQNVLTARGELGAAPEHLPLRLLPALFFPFVYSALYAPVFGSTAVDLGGRVYGWMPAGVVFLGFTGMIASIFRRNRRMLMLSLIVVCFLLWMMDVPPFNVLRYLPLVQRLTLAYLLCSIQLFVCVLAGYGASALASASQRELVITGGAWTIFTGASFALVVSVLKSLGPLSGLLHSQPAIDRSCVVAGIVPNAMWAIAAPMLFYGARFFSRWTDLKHAPIAVAFAVVLGSAMAFFPSGAAYLTVFLTRTVALLAVIICLMLTVRQRSLERIAWTTIATLLVANVVLVENYPGWPQRTDPFAEPPYVHYIKTLPQNGREYGLQGILFPDFSSKLSIPTFNELTMLLPRSSVYFMMRYADTCQDPDVFYGIAPVGCPDLPLVQILKHRAVWDYLGLRHILGADRDQIKADIVASEPPLSDFTAVPVAGAVRFPVVVRNGATAIEVLIGTAGRNTQGVLTFDLKDTRGNSLIQERVDGAKLPTQDWVTFTRDANAEIPPGIHTAELAFRPNTPESAIVLWKDEKRPDSFRYRVRIEDAGLKLAFYSPDDHVSVWQNQSVKPLVYVAPQSALASSEADAEAKFVAQLDLHRVAYQEAGATACADNAKFPEDQEGSALGTIAITANRVDTTLEAKSPGALVFVGTYADGWMARIDGHPAKTFRANGAFLGACLDTPGSHQVTFEYRPPLWYPSLAASAAGLVLASLSLLRLKVLTRGETLATLT